MAVVYLSSLIGTNLNALMAVQAYESANDSVLPVMTFEKGEDMGKVVALVPKSVTLKYMYMKMLLSGISFYIRFYPEREIIAAIENVTGASVIDDVNPEDLIVEGATSPDVLPPPPGIPGLPSIPSISPATDFLRNILIAGAIIVGGAIVLSGQLRK